MAHAFKAGDVVQLKSGGPRMTIEEIGRFGHADRDQAKCVWFDRTTRKEDLFELDPSRAPGPGLSFRSQSPRWEPDEAPHRGPASSQNRRKALQLLWRPINSLHKRTARNRRSS